ncbi:hypothetical protein FW774_01085 (plasmid) [Pedobacter sp. BS3]|uniref:hypothetical protein n=1 Tax=Pedobacter sp. BS3 TaxID=2567937 RepID=UPI0011F02473|nr:hypothetical protein [Pedobacter sp. BS3]TZF85701.1 hypothetical protein FW774_01085 [Pedobacter sp. BS3]
MAALIIESKNPSNLKVLAAMTKQLGDTVKAVNIEDIEDMIFGDMMTKAKTGKFVTKQELLKKLRSAK